MSIGHILKVFLITIGVLIGAVFLLLISLYLAQYIKTHIIPPCGGNKQFDPTLKYTTSFNIPGIISGLPALKGLKSINGSIQGNADGKDSNTGKFTITFNEVYYDTSRNPSPTLFPDQQYTYNIDNCKLSYTLCNDECVKNNPTDYPSGNNESVTSYLSNYQITLQSPAYLLEDGSILLRGCWNAPSGIPNIPLQLKAYPSGTQYGCKDDKCVATKGGKYSTSNCNHQCSKPVIGYSCNYVTTPIKGDYSKSGPVVPPFTPGPVIPPTPPGPTNYNCIQRIGHIGEPNFYTNKNICEGKCRQLVPSITGYKCTQDKDGKGSCYKSSGSSEDTDFYLTKSDCKKSCKSSGYNCETLSDNIKKCIQSPGMPGTKDFYKNDVMCKLKCK